MVHDRPSVGIVVDATVGTTVGMVGDATVGTTVG
jgi:hypothetical protein